MRPRQDNSHHDAENALNKARRQAQPLCGMALPPQFLPQNSRLERLAEQLIVSDAVAVKQYSVDLRERLLRAIDAGLSQAEAVRLFGVGTATIARWRWRQRERGSVAPWPRQGRPRRIGRAQERAL